MDEQILFAAGSHFSAKQLSKFSSLGRSRICPKDTVLQKHGTTSRDCYLIQDGRLELHRPTSYGDFAVSQMQQGELCGELGFLDGQPSALDLVSTTRSRLLMIKPWELEREMAGDPIFEVAMYWAFWRTLAYRLRQTNDRLTRFFGDEPAPQAQPAPGPLKEVDLDIESRRAIFRELGLSSMEINYLASLAEAQQLEPNQPLFREGDPGTVLYVVADGRIMISKQIPGAGEEALAFLDRGQLFGEMALLEDRPRSTDARAASEGAILLAIRKEVLSKVLNIEKASSIRLLKNLCRLMASRVRETHEKIIGWYILSGGDHSSSL